MSTLFLVVNPQPSVPSLMDVKAGAPVASLAGLNRTQVTRRLTELAPTRVAIAPTVRLDDEGRPDGAVQYVALTPAVLRSIQVNAKAPDPSSGDALLVDKLLPPEQVGPPAGEVSEPAPAPESLADAAPVDDKAEAAPVPKKEFEEAKLGKEAKDKDKETKDLKLPHAGPPARRTAVESHTSGYPALSSSSLRPPRIENL